MQANSPLEKKIRMFSHLKNYFLIDYFENSSKWNFIKSFFTLNDEIS